MSLHHRQYRSAVALNNIGVRLLERNCYVQAVSTLQNASRLIKALLRTAPSAADDSDGGEELVQQAMRALAEPSRSRQTAMHIDTITMIQDGMLVCGKGNDTFPSTAPNSLLEASISSCIAFPIRIEDHLQNIHTQPSNLSNMSPLIIQAAIMWYNLGIAYLCLGQVAKTNRQRHIQASLNASKRAHAVLVKQNDFLQRSDSFRMRIHEMPSLIVGVTHSLVHALYQSSQTNKAEHMAANLQQLQRVAADMRNHNMLVKNVLGVSTSAPAA